MRFDFSFLSSGPRTILLIHGLWTTPRVWNHFKTYFEERGHPVLAPAWPGADDGLEELRRDPSAMAGLGIEEIADHYECIIRGLERPPILIGHCVGGLVVQMLLDRGLGSAGVSISAPAPHGVSWLPFTTLKAGLPALGNLRNYRRTVTLTFEQFHQTFAHTMNEEDAWLAYEAYAAPAPGRPLFQLALSSFTLRPAHFVRHLNRDRSPLLLLAGREDQLVPPVVNALNYKLYRRSSAITDYREFPGRSHLIIAQPGWEEVALYALNWSAKRTVSAELAARRN
ncbi:alpha/beta fold hydrolase [Verrucomicrobium sp. BvORR106]|uniref:alpha/beta hydrolase n=1 Tax=Verrucomicrobium sp. BvORR106 TaxID=1403819 RepID=UPI000571DAEC|nr:alpha/beta fold hydrolase [Verrucomicrobium sp. BvORR106]